jgi:hypothetical protein
MREGPADWLRTAAEQVVPDWAHALPDHDQLRVGPELIGDLLDDPGHTVLYRQHRRLGPATCDRVEGRCKGGVSLMEGTREQLLRRLFGISTGLALVGDRPLSRLDRIRACELRTQDPSAVSPTVTTAP